MSQDVLLRHPPRSTRAFDLRQVHVVLRRDPPHQRRRTPTEPFVRRLVPAVPRGSGCGLRLRRRGRLCFRGFLDLGFRSRRCGFDLRALGLGFRRRRGLRRPGLRRRSTVCIDVGDDRADLHGLALLHLDIDQRAGRRRRNLCVDLVRGDLQDRLVALHRVARLFQPLRDGPLGDGLPHLRHRHFDLRHLPSRGALVRLPASSPSGTCTQ
jgi:hypothetical protein